jgi:hypothetical protein
MSTLTTTFSVAFSIPRFGTVIVKSVVAPP